MRRGRPKMLVGEQKTVRFTMRINEREYNEMKQFADSLGLTIADAIRTVIHAYMSGDGSGVINPDQMDLLDSYNECANELKELKKKVKIAKGILSDLL